METVIIVIMILVCFSFLLKQTWRKLRSVIITALIVALFAGLTWQYAIEQSKTQIEDWLANTELMLDISVILSIEVLLQMAFCMLAVHIATTGVVKKHTLMTYKILRWFPGLLIFPVIFSCLVYLIFEFPGHSFASIAWTLAICIFILTPLCSILFRKMLPEKELRLELLFLTNALIAILGIIATVNGQTAVKGIAEVEWGALAGVGIISIAGGMIGTFIYRIKKYKN